MKESEGKILGVIGGMGPLASQLFYKMVIEMTEAHADQEHLNMIILNHATMPDRTEAILSGKLEPLWEGLVADGRLLAENGACAVAIPCNTSHFLIEGLQEALPIPVINMIREAVTEAAGRPGVRRVGILATDGTIRTELYQKECEAQGLIPVIPSVENQRRVMKIIYDGVKNGGPIDYADFEKIEAELLREECDCAIMACTELSCFKDMYKLPDYYLDALEALAKRSILHCGKTLVNESR